MATPKLADLIAGPRIVRVTTWPGKQEIPVGLRVLTGAEHQEAAVEAAKHFEAQGVQITPVTLEVYQDHLSVCRLSRALVTPEPPHTRLVAGSMELQRLLTNSDKIALLEEYLDLEESASASLEAMSEPQALELLEQLKNGQRHWTDLKPSTLRELSLSMASRLWTSQTDSGSPSSP